MLYSVQCQLPRLSSPNTKEKLRQLEQMWTSLNIQVTKQETEYMSLISYWSKLKEMCNISTMREEIKINKS